MKRKILIGVVVVIGIAVAFFMIPLTTGALIVAWIYLAWMVWKKKTQIFHDRMEPKSAERRLKWLKVSLLVAAVFLVGGIVGAVVNQALYATEIEDAVTFFFAFVGVCVFILATSSGLYIFLQGRRKTIKGDTEISTT